MPGVKKLPSGAPASDARSTCARAMTWLFVMAWCNAQSPLARTRGWRRRSRGETRPASDTWRRRRRCSRRAAVSRVYWSAWQTSMRQRSALPASFLRCSGAARQQATRTRIPWTRRRWDGPFRSTTSGSGARVSSRARFAGLSRRPCPVWPGHCRCMRIDCCSQAPRTAKAAASRSSLPTRVRWQWTCWSTSQHRIHGWLAWQKNMRRACHRSCGARRWRPFQTCTRSRASMPRSSARLGVRRPWQRTARSRTRCCYSASPS